LKRFFVLRWTVAGLGLGLGFGFYIFWAPRAATRFRLGHSALADSVALFLHTIIPRPAPLRYKNAHTRKPEKPQTKIRLFLACVAPPDIPGDNARQIPAAQLAEARSCRNTHAQTSLTPQTRTGVFRVEGLKAVRAWLA
jgi:hypothetical protein